MRIFIIGSTGTHTKQYFIDWIDGRHTFIKKSKNADLFLFIGNHPINPKFFNEKEHPSVILNHRQDKEFSKAFNYASKHNINMIGINSGATFLAAMSNAYIFQKVQNHAVGHYVVTDKKGYESKTMFTTSNHCQMIYPYILKDNMYELLAWSNGLSSYYWGSCLGAFPKKILHSKAFITVTNKAVDHVIGFKIPETKQVFKEPEVVFFPYTNSLCIQSNPELMDHNEEYIKFLNQIIKEKLQ